MTVGGYITKKTIVKVKKKVKKVIKELKNKGFKVEKKKTKFIIFKSKKKT